MDSLKLLCLEILTMDLESLLTMPRGSKVTCVRALDGDALDPERLTGACGRPEMGNPGTRFSPCHLQAITAWYQLMSLPWFCPATSHSFRVTAGRDLRHLLVQISDLRDEEAET